MSRQKRKAPERKKKNRRNPFISGASAVGHMAFNHPGIAGGTLTFGVIFSFVAANALWYQPGAHPHPLLDTRAAFNAYAARAAAIDTSPAANGVTTYKLTPAPKPVTPVTKAPVKKAAIAPQPAPVQKTQTDIVVIDETRIPITVDEKPSGDDLVRQIQANLAKRGIYFGDVDGLMGPKTEAAITHYQKTRGMEADGQPHADVLSALKSDNAEFDIVPIERPNVEITGTIAPKPKPAVDPLAALIKNDAKKAEMKTANTALVERIQQGLTNLGYGPIKVDGIAGKQTQTAIRSFQKHYHLPVNGEPNKLVYEKLKQIDAFEIQGNG